MALRSPPPEAAVSLRRVFPAPRPKVFRLWTEPELIKRWFGGPQTKVLHVEIDLRVGGHYRIVMQPEGGLQSQVAGIYREIEVPAKLAFTWNLVNLRMESGETLVTVSFHDLGPSTEVILVHQPFPDANVRAMHVEGWNVCFEAMASLI